MIFAEELLVVAREAAAAGADVASGWWRRAELLVNEKAAPDDLVSQADHETETAVRAVLARLRPDDAILGEEAGATAGTSGVRWAVDPIDGTTNYLYGRPDWAVSVAATAADGRVLAGVVTEPALGRTTEAFAGGGTWADGERVPPLKQTDLGRALIELNLGRNEQKRYAARTLDALIPRVRDVRRGGSAAVGLAQVATGRADGAWLPGLNLWDYAAGFLLVAEAGGTVGDLHGPSEAPPVHGDVLAAPPALWEPLRQLLHAARSS
ncbi:MAG TPA: inositol monophosphatase family protein [Sporichthya sp.]|nr:inositol monophosphatase family protein [Sporichthya sp.]